MKFKQKFKKLADNLKNIGITKNDVIKSDTLFENDFSTPNGDFVFELIEKVFKSLPIEDSDLLPPRKYKNNISSGGVIKSGNNLMGCIYTIYLGGVHYVQIATLPKYRSLGLSKILWVRLLESLSKLPQKLRDTPIRQMDIAWKVDEDNIKSRNLAKRLGF